MSTTLQFRRYDTANVANTTGANGEIIIDSDKDTVVVQDGATVGGFPLARESTLNAAYAQANTARNQANSGSTQADTARDQANAAYGQANAAYADANTRVLKAGDTMTGNLNVAATLITQNIIPNLNVTYDIGTAENRFRDLYLSGGTIYLGDSVLEAAQDEMRANTFNAAISFVSGGLNVLDQANSAREQANTARNQANTARGVANDSYAQANSAYAEANLKLNIAGGTITGSLVVAGNLEVLGNSTTLNVETLSVEDNEIILNSNVTGSPALDAFITINRGSDPNAQIKWDEGSNQWKWVDGDGFFFAFDSALDAYQQANDAYAQANTARETANNSYATANGALAQADDARAQANTARDQANTARGQANTAYGQANDAYAQANTARNTANDALTQANSARDQANNSYAQANSAYAEANLKLNIAGGTITGNLVVSGNLEVLGNSTTLNVETLSVEDNEIILNSSVSAPPTLNAYITINRGTLTNAELVWDETNDEWKWSDGDNVYHPLNATLDAYLQANTARDQANTARDQANSAYGQANDAYSQANSAYADANTRVLKAGDTMTGTLNVNSHISANVFRSTNTTLSAPSLSTFDGERLRLYDFQQAGHPNYAIGVEGSHIWMGVDDIGPTLGFKWYGNTTLVGLLRTNSTFEVSNTVAAKTIRANGTGTAIDASQGNILTNQVTGTQFNFLSGLYTASITGSGTVNSNYTLNLPPNTGLAGQMLTTDGTGNLNWSSSTLDTANGAYNQANDAYSQANTARNQANTARGTANDAYAQANTARGTANDAYAQANAAYADANTRVLKAGDTMTGNLNVAATLITQNIVPDLNVTYSLGTADKRFKDIYLSGGTIYLGDTVLSATEDEMRANTFNAAVSFVSGGLNILDQANSARGQANTARDQANTARDTANGAYAQANGAYGQANGAYGQANGAYGQANTGIETANGAYAQANGAYGQANGAYGQANGAYASANGAYAQANIAYGQANDAYGQANTARLQANNAYAEANLKLNLTGGTIAGSLNVSGDLAITGNTVYYNVSTYSIEDSLLYVAANNELTDLVDIGFIGGKNTAGVYSHTGLARHAGDGIYYLFDNLTDEGHQNNVIDVANTTYAMLRANIEAQSINVGNVPVANTNLANGAYAQANGAYAHANIVYAQANSGYDQANSARDQANTARGVANDSYSQANTARDQANTARTTANDSYGQANTARDQANTARDQANTARDQANTARDTANGAYGQANGAYAQANGAYSQANSAYAHANIVYAQANAAYGQANAAYADANTRVLKAGDTMTGNLNVAATIISQNIVPNLNVTYSLGTPTLRFKDLYVGGNTIYIGDTVLSASGDEMRANTFNAAVSFISAGLNVLDQANSARDQANTARNQANTARDTANSAYGAANSSSTVGQNAYAQANTARDTANGAYGQANGAYAHANIVYAQANTARDQANSARDQANTARNQANTAYGQANDAYAAANTKLPLVGGTISGDLVISGNLVVSGNSTTLNTETLIVEDAEIILLSNVAGTPALNAGLIINRGTSANTFLRWNEGVDKWGWSDDGTTFYSFDTSLIAYSQANSARDQANTARTTANDAYGAANTRVLKAGDTMTGNLIMSGATVNTVTANITTIITGNTLTLSTGAASNGNVVISANGVEYVRTTNTGNVGIGQTNPAYKLDISGDVRATGNVFALNFDSTSDLVMKENVREIENPLETLKQLHGVMFTWKDSKNDSLGVIAQELEKVLPQLTSTNAEGKKSVTYNGIIALLIEAVKELAEKVEKNN